MDIDNKTGAIIAIIIILVLAVVIYVFATYNKPQFLQLPTNNNPQENGIGTTNENGEPIQKIKPDYTRIDIPEETQEEKDRGKIGGIDVRIPIPGQGSKTPSVNDSGEETIDETNNCPYECCDTEEFDEKLCKVNEVCTNHECIVETNV